MKVKDLKPNSNVSLRVRVCSKGTERSVSKNRYNPLRVCEFKVGDSTGKVGLTMFNEQIDSLARVVGEVIDINDGWSKKYQGKMQLSMGRNGDWDVVKDKNFPTSQAILQGVGSVKAKKPTKAKKPSLPSTGTKIKDLTPDSTVSIKLRICAQEEERVMTKNQATPLRVCNFTVGDDSGHANLTLFNDQIDRFSSLVGQVIELKDGWTKIWQGDLQLSMGRSGSFEIIKDKKFPSINQILPSISGQTVKLSSSSLQADILDLGTATPSIVKVSQIVPNMNVSTTVRVCEQKTIKYVNQSDGSKLRVRDYLIGDDTGVISFTAFNEEIKEMGAFVGKVIELENCWAKFWNKTLQVSKGQNGTWKLGNDKGFPSKEDLLDRYNKLQLETLTELSHGTVYYSSIKGIRFQAQGKTIYKKDAMTELELIPEPQNPYDDKAVGIWLDGKQMGYVPRTQNKAIFKALEDGDPQIKCMLGIFRPSINTGYNLPHHVKDMPITISTHVQEIEWRPVVLLPEDVMAF
jgi:ssDNA-binding replication factor A large subunit